MGMLWAEKCYKYCHFYLKKYQKQNIPIPWVVGLIAVECARLDPKAKRFEPHVYKSVQHVKQGGQSTAFPGFNSGKIKEFIKSTNNIEMLKSVATSYGLGQLMGYHYIDKFNMKYEEFSNQTFETSIKTLIDFMFLNMKRVKFPELIHLGKHYSPYEQLLRMHNTGSATGSTYHANYVQNAIQAMKDYEKLMEQKGEI